MSMRHNASHPGDEVSSAEANFEPGAPLVHPDKASNVVAEVHVRKLGQGDTDVEAAFAAADIVARRSQMVFEVAQR